MTHTIHYLIVMYIMKYLLQFTIASSFLVFIGFYRFVHKKIQEGVLEIDYYQYSIIMPLWFGLLNVLSLYLQETFHISYRMRFLLITFIGLSVLFPTIHGLQVYNYEPEQWLYHDMMVTISYLFIWNVVIFGLEKILTHKKFSTSDIVIMSFLSFVFLSV